MQVSRLRKASAAHFAPHQFRVNLGREGAVCTIDATPASLADYQGQQPEGWFTRHWARALQLVGILGVKSHRDARQDTSVLEFVTAKRCAYSCVTYHNNTWVSVITCDPLAYYGMVLQAF